MKHVFYSALTMIFAAAAIRAEPAALFDGKTLDGWECDVADIWRIEEGELVAGRPDVKQPVNVFLCTRREFGDFDLRLKFKSDGNNGGIQFRSQRKAGSHEVAGYQADFAKGIHGFLYDESRRRKFLAQPEAETSAKLQLGEWNSYRIRAEGPRIRLWVNDVLTVDYTEPDSAIPLRGIIGLQVHANATEIRYKDLVIEELEDKAAAGMP